MRYYDMLTRMAKMKKNDHRKCRWGHRGTETHRLLVGIWNGATTLENSFLKY